MQEKIRRCTQVVVRGRTRNAIGPQGRVGSTPTISARIFCPQGNVPLGAFLRCARQGTALLARAGIRLYIGCLLSSIWVLKTRSRNMTSKKGGKHQVPICWAINPKTTGVSMILALEKAISMPMID